MPPMARQVPDPLKQLKQKQAAEAKLLAAQQRRRSSQLREQAKIREAEATEKAANAERLKTPPIFETQRLRPQQSRIAARPTKGPSAPQETGDPAILSNFTLSEEGEGDNISGNKELRDGAEHEDENNSKRPKVPLNPVAT